MDVIFCGRSTEQIFQGGKGEMKSSDDIVLLLASDGSEWGRFLTDKLNRFPHVSHTTVELNTQQQGPTALKSACHQSSVVLLLATQGLLNYMRRNASWFAPTLRELSSTSSLVVLLLVGREHLDDVTQTCGFITGEWRYKDIGDVSVTAVQHRIAEVLDIVDQKRQTGKEKSPMSSPAGSSKTAVEFFPSTVYEPNIRVAMVFKEEIRGEVTLKLLPSDPPLTATKETATVFTFTAPQKPPGKYKVLVFVNNKRLRSRAELTFRGTEMASLASPRFLAQTLRLNSVQDLDLHLKDLFNDSLPADQSLELLFRHLPELDFEERQKKADTHYPTLLHYAAAYGLSEFSAALLDCPGSSRAFCLRNCEGLDPAELAAEHGFYDLEDYMLDFMELHAAANESEDHYMKMNPILMGNESRESFYANPLHDDPSPTEESSQSSILRSDQVPALPPRPQKMASLSSATFSGSGTLGPDSRMERPSAPATYRPPLPPPRGGDRATWSRLSSPAHAQTAKRDEVQQKASTLPPGAKLDPLAFVNPNSSSQTELPAGAVGSSSLSELIEVQELVKGQELNQHEAVMFLRSWQKQFVRNPAASFKDRQRELTKMKSKCKERIMEEEKTSQGAAQPRGLFTRFFFPARNRKPPTSKLHISEPVLSPKAKKGPTVYSRVGSDSQLPVTAAERDSAISMTSATGEYGRGSRQVRLSNVSTSGEAEAEIREPVLSPKAKKGPTVYSRVGSDSQLPVTAADRDSAISMTSSAGECGRSSQRCLSNVSSSGDAEADSGEDDVFGQEGNISRRFNRTDVAAKRLSLGDLYLQQQGSGTTDRETDAPPPLPRLNLPPVPTLDKPSNGCSDPDTDSVTSEVTYL